MVVKIRFKMDTAKLKRIIEKRKKLLQANVKTVILFEAIPVLMELVMAGYDGLGDRMDLLPEDPTNPVNWRQSFSEQLEQDLADSFRTDGTTIRFGLGNKDVLGYTASGRQEEGDDTPLHWLVFYLEGLAGEWGFITKELYEKHRSPEGGSEQFGAGGKFGAGFMISRDEFFDEGWEKVIPWSSVRHPFSSFSPLDIFTEALQEFSIRRFIDKAMKATSEGRTL